MDNSLFRSRARADLNAKRDSGDSLDDQHSERRDNDSRPLSKTDTKKRIPSNCNVDSPGEEKIQRKENLETASEKCAKRAAPSSKRTLEQRDELARSKLTVNGSTHYQCNDCGKILSTSYNFLVHRNTHTGERPCTCHVCGKSFRSASGLNRHVRNVHAGMKQFACDICGRCLASKASRDEHRRTHTGERPHVCEACGKSFKQKASLHVHKSFHSNRFPHKCPQCEQGFRRKQELDKHVSVHTEQRPYPCDVCGKRFRTKGCISRHKRVHSGDRGSYVCIVCDARFSQQRYLESHRKNLHAATRSMA